MTSQYRNTLEENNGEFGRTPKAVTMEPKEGEGIRNDGGFTSRERQEKAEEEQEGGGCCGCGGSGKGENQKDEGGENEVGLGNEGSRIRRN